MYFVIIMAQLKSGPPDYESSVLTILGYYLPTFSGYEEKLNLIIIKEGIFNCWGSFFYSQNLLFDESRIFSEEFVCVWLYIGIPAGLLPYIAYTGTCMCHWAGYICFLTSLSWKGYIILCVSVNRILPRWILVYKTNDCNANLLNSNCQ